MATRKLKSLRPGELWFSGDHRHQRTGRHQEAEKKRPDLFLLDVMTPGMERYEVCRWMRADPDLKEMPIIVVTAMLDLKLNFKGSANLAIRKPFEPKMLLDPIERAFALKAKPSTS